MAVDVVRGQCLEHYGDGEAYLPVLDGLARLCRAPGGERIIELLRQYAPAWLLQLPSLLPAAERQACDSKSTAPLESNCCGRWPTPAELAMHFEQGRDGGRAVKYLLQAAENATNRAAHHEAEALARRARRER